MRGWADLLLCGAVLVAGWTRTPAGALAQAAASLVSDVESPHLLATFRTGVSDRVNRTIERVQVERQVAKDGWSAALRSAIAAHLGEEALAEIEAQPIAARGDTELALEVWAIGQDQRTRAISRAMAAGEAQPKRYENHRRFLPDESARAADRAVSEVLALATAMDLVWPVDTSARVTSPYGWRTHPTLHTRKFHEGVDIAVPVGTAVNAANGGSVVRAKKDALNGNYVIVDHGYGVRTAYCHGDKLVAQAGTTVKRGDHIMDSGNTGRSTGPHLHFGMRIDGRPIDPGTFREVTTPDKADTRAATAGEAVVNAGPTGEAPAGP